MRMRTGISRRGKFCLYALLAALLLAGALLAGCAAAGDPVADEAAPEGMPDMPAAEDARDDGEYAGADEGAAAEERRHVIREARLAMLVRDLEEALEEVQQMVTALGGYLSSMNLHGMEREQRAGQVVVRVPEEKFEQALDEFEQLGELKDKNIFTDDVTGEYVDMEARIANLEAQEERFRELLQQAENIEEMLQVENELGRIRGDLEAMQARFESLRDRVSYSTITINFEEQDPRRGQVVGETEGMGRRIVSLFSLNLNRLIAALSGIAVFLLGTLPITLPLIAVAVGGWKMRKLWKKRKEGKN